VTRRGANLSWKIFQNIARSASCRRAQGSELV
jgi:hypothetical protein